MAEITKAGLRLLEAPAYSFSPGFHCPQEMPTSVSKVIVSRWLCLQGSWGVGYKPSRESSELLLLRVTGSSVGCMILMDKNTEDRKGQSLCFYFHDGQHIHHFGTVYWVRFLILPSQQFPKQQLGEVPHSSLTAVS